MQRRPTTWVAFAGAVVVRGQELGIVFVDTGILGRVLSDPAARSRRRVRGVRYAEW
jgi:hypothetical protein